MSDEAKENEARRQTDQGVNSPMPLGTLPGGIRNGGENIPVAATATFLRNLQNVLVTDHADALTKSCNAMQASGVVCRLGKAVQLANPEALVGLLGFYQKNEIDILLQITDFLEAEEIFRVTDVETPSVVLSMSKKTLESMGAVHLSMMKAFLGDGATGLPYAGAPKGVRLCMAEDGCSTVLFIGNPTGAGVQVPLSMSTARTQLGEERLVPPPHHSDPMKQRVRMIPEPTVEVLLDGKYSRAVDSNRNYMDVYASLAGGGYEVVEEDGDIGECPTIMETPTALCVSISAETCLHLLNMRVIDLYNFKSQPMGTDVYNGKHNAVVCTEALKRSITVEEVEGCWNNCRRAFQRVFGLSKEWDLAWRLAWTQMQEWKIKAEWTRPLLKYGPVQLALFNVLIIRFLAGSTHPNVTKSLVQHLLRLFRVDFKDIWIREEYDAIARMYNEEMMQKLVRQREQPGGGLGDGPSPKKLRGLGHPAGNGALNGAGAGGAGGAGGTGGIGSGAPKAGDIKRVCHEFLSAGGCTRGAGCRFPHHSVKAAPQPQKDKFKAALLAKGLAPDPSKF